MKPPGRLVRLYERSPGLEDIMRAHGNTNLLSYARATLPGRPSVSASRVEEFLSVFGARAKDAVGEVGAIAAVNELRHQYGLSTAEHHGPLVHPFFLDAALVNSWVRSEQGLRTMPVLAFGNVSLSNSSFPRGLLFHDDDGAERRLAFAGWRDRRRPVYGLPAYDEERVGKLILAIHKTRALESDKKEQLANVLRTVYGRASALEPRLYADQVARTNYELWKLVPGMEEMMLVYLQIEDVVSDLLLHALSSATPLARLVLDPAMHAAYEKHFNNVRGAFSEDHGTGTMLFWGISDQRVPLRRQSDWLVDGNGKKFVRLEAHALSEAMREKRVMPSLSLCLMVVALYYGVRCGGGFSQVTYLMHIRDAYLQMLESSGVEPERHERDVRADWLTGDLLFAYLKQGIPATTIDLLIHGGSDQLVRLREIAEKMTLHEAAENMLACYRL
jgi:hypothetical protein